jgi:hypothetical protein
MNPMDRLSPITPGELLDEEFLQPLGVSLYRLAKAIDVPAQACGPSCAPVPLHGLWSWDNPGPAVENSNDHTSTTATGGIAPTIAPTAFPLRRSSVGSRFDRRLGA